MGIRSYVRDRKQVKASRAALNGAAGHDYASAVMGRALGWTDGGTAATPNGRVFSEVYPNKNNPQYKNNEAGNNDEGVQRTGQAHVNVIPGGSKPRTPRNSDWDAPAGQVAKD